MERRDHAGISQPNLIIFIDELADLMLVAREPVETSITRLVQRGREAGIHVIACTQKPTTAILGSLVTANFPARIVGKVVNDTDAKVAAGVNGTGAERLSGQGTFVLVIGGDITPLQSAFVSEEEIVDFVVKQRGGRPISTTPD